MNSKTITICGKEVEMLYCAATETGYESISGQSCEIFIPQSIKDNDGHEQTQLRATTTDYIRLAIAAVIAAYQRKGEEAPVTADDILYNATSKEVQTLITTVIELRTAWYLVPAVIKDEDVKNEDDEEKEAKPKNS
jgi:hypothetical protein